MVKKVEIIAAVSKGIMLGSKNKFRNRVEKVNQDYKDAKMLILDSYDDDHYGGTGKTFDLSLIKNKIDLPFLLAGGIDKDNFHQALNLKNCIGIDVCSSVEEKPGYKNHAQVKSLVEKVRSYYV